MERIAFVLLFLATTSTYAAEDVCKGRTSTTCFIDLARGTLSMCQGTASMELELARLNGTPPTYACIKSGFAEVEPRYARAARASKGPQLDRLKDFYASWRAAMTGIPPDAGEVRIAYTTRQTAITGALEAKAERLKLD